MFRSPYMLRMNKDSDISALDPSKDSDISALDPSREYIEYDTPADTTFDVPVDFILSSLIEKDNEENTWIFRKGSGSALVSKFTTENGRPISFVSTVERGSRPCSMSSSSSRSYMYKVLKCAHRSNNEKGVRPCMARATLKFSILFEQDVERAGLSYRAINVIWDKGNGDSPIPCIHLKGATARGVVRKHERNRLTEMASMPSHMTMESIRANSKAFEQLLTGNRTGLLISQSAAHKARVRGRKELYEKEGDVVLDLGRIRRECWDRHRQDGFQNLPIQGKLKSFMGTVHDLRAMGDGGFSGLTLFTAVSLEIHRRLIETRSENAKSILMDSTQFREAEVLVSVHTDHVLRSLSRGAKLRYSTDKQHVWVKPLHTFLVLRLETGTEKHRTTQPFICAEHISVDRTAGEMKKFLETYFGRLEFYIGVKAYPAFFVSDEDKAFTAAAVWVFNRMYVSEYGALLLLSSQRKDEAIRCESVRTTSVHCTVHKSRNLRDYIHDLAKERKEKKDGEVYTSLNRFMQQLFAFVRSADSYEELCHRTGAINYILSTKSYPYLPPGDEGKLIVVASTADCVERGGEELWRRLTPTNRPPPDTKPVHRVRLESRLGKEQLDWDLELQLNNELEEEIVKDVAIDGAGVEVCGQEPILGRSSESFEANGICKLSYGRFDAYVMFESKIRVDGVDRVLVQYHCPFLSGYGYGDGGFKMLYRLSEVSKRDVHSPLCAEGRSLQFFRTSVFANAVFLCDALTGRAPLTHNISVEVAIRNRKHVDEIGLQMKTCAKGMRLPEYVSRRAKWIDNKNVLQISLMLSRRMSARRRPKAADHLLPNRKKSRLTDIARNCDVDRQNGLGCSTLLNNRESSSDPLISYAAVPAIVRGYDGGLTQDFPSTQLSLSQEARTESVWNSTRGVSGVRGQLPESEADKTIVGFLNKATEQLRAILSPLGSTELMLSLLCRHIGSREAENVSSENVSAERIKVTLDAVVGFDCFYFSEISNQTLLNTWFSILESSTVWEEGVVGSDCGKCELIPFVQRRIAMVRDGEPLHFRGSDVGDDQKCQGLSRECLLEDMRVLVRSKWSMANDFRLSSRIMDQMTALYSKLVGRARRNILVQQSQWLTDMVSMNFTLKRLLSAKNLSFLVHQCKKAFRQSFMQSWDDAEQLLCPFLVNKNTRNEKWICLAAFQSSRVIKIYDSSASIQARLSTEIKSAVEALKTFLLYHSSPNWAGKYKCCGVDLQFPQQVGNRDSGVLILLACRFALLGLENKFSIADIENYRCRFANELYVQRAT